MFTEHVQSRVEQRDATRRKVLGSAERLFRSRGFDATTIRQIATDAGVSTGTVMGVGDKDGLLVATFDDWIAAVHRDRKTLGETLSRGGTVENILGLFDPFLGYFAQDRALTRRYTSIIVRGSHQSSIFEDLAMALVTEIKTALLHAGLGDRDAARGARTIYFAYLGIVMTGGNLASGDLSVLDQLREVIDCVVAPKGKGVQL